MILNITPELKETFIALLITAITIQISLLITYLIFAIREKKTGKTNPLNKEWP